MTAKNPYFREVDLKINFPEEEKKILDHWYKKGIVKKYLDKNKNSKKYFSFLDGPITANNPMGVHHAWGRTYKDLYQRFKNMQGYAQRFQNGFDAQGLWVEVEVERELKFQNKKDIEKFGIEKFVALCRERVKKYSGIQTEQSKRLGYFMDWDNSYYTLSEDNNYMIWRFLKTCHENGWLYKGNDSVAWCPRCETAISQHEMLTEDYKEATHDSVYLSFPIVNRTNEYLLVWTTTPWTVPANIAVAVDPRLEYAKVAVGDLHYWVAKDSVERVFKNEKHNVVKAASGEKLLGTRYMGAFDDLPAVTAVSKKYSENFHSVVPTDSMIMPITTTEGTGLVHTAVSAGTEDFKLGQKLGLPMIPVIKDDATYLDNFGFLSGQNAKDDPWLVLGYLKQLKKAGKEFYYKIEKYTHRYPACWRCKTELVWKVTDEWYVAMDKPAQITNNKLHSPKNETENTDNRTLRQRMIDVTKKIKWIPGFGLEREIDWLNNMHDWLISKKNRYWGLALPIWECDKCHNFEVIGSKEELERKAVEGWDSFKDRTPHKPHIDLVKVKCSSCGHIMSRIEPVGNPWLDAGIVAYSTVSENNKAANFEASKTKPLYLSDKNKWKDWVPADFITESFPGQFKNWFYSLIAMSTVMEDINPFKTVLGFGTLLAEDGRPMHKSWGNSIEFTEGADTIGVDVMRWMYARQNPADNLLFGYKNADEVRRSFHLTLWNVYNFFVTYANLNNWEPKKELKLKVNNLLDGWIVTRLYQSIVDTTALLEKYDARSASEVLESFVNDMSLWYVRRSRDRVSLSSSDKSDTLDFLNFTYFVLINISKVLAPFVPFLSESMYTNLSKDSSVHLASWPSEKDLKTMLGIVSRNIDPNSLLDQMKIIRAIVEKGHSLRKENGIAVKQPLSLLTVQLNDLLDDRLTDLLKAELNVKEVKYVIKKGEMKVTLDTKVTVDLMEEMKVRELIRKIQNERKEMGLNLTQKVDVENEWIPENKDFVQLIIKKAQVRELIEGKFNIAKVK
jgi:isoleucyl-tRNA synthetase